MNQNTTTQGAAGASAGAAMAATTLIIWFISLFHVNVPSEVAVAMTTLLSVGTHALVTHYTPKDATVNLPVETVHATVQPVADVAWKAPPPPPPVPVPTPTPAPLFPDRPVQQGI